jgi:hypothetical protein
VSPGKCLVTWSGHPLNIFGRDSGALAACGGDVVILPLQLGGRGIDPVVVEEDAARLQVRTYLAIDLANALEVTQVVQTAG